jgi:hypothetical protein
VPADALDHAAGEQPVAMGDRLDGADDQFLQAGWAQVG